MSVHILQQHPDIFRLLEIFFNFLFVLKREINGKELTMVFHRDYTSVFLFHKVFWVGRKTSPSAVPGPRQIPSWNAG